MLHTSNSRTDFSNERLLLEKSGFFKEQKELIEFRYQLKSWPQTIGGDYKMEVTLNEGKEFSWNWTDNKVALGIGYIDQVFHLLQNKYTDLPVEDVKKMTLEALYGAAIHEGLHRKYTVRPSELLDNVEMQALFSNVGFAHMNNSIEDPRINTTCAKNYSALFPKIHTYIEADIVEGGDLYYGNLMKDKTGWIPRFSQCGAEYMMFWEYLLSKTNLVHDGRVERKSIDDTLEIYLNEKTYQVDEKVAEVLRKTAYDMVRSFMAIPNEDTIFAMSKKSMDINKDIIWPIFKELVQEDQEKMEKNGMINYMFHELLESMGEEMAEQFLQELLEQMKEHGARNKEDSKEQEHTEEAQDANGASVSSEEQEKGSEIQTDASGEQKETPTGESDTKSTLEDLKRALEEMKEEKDGFPVDSEQLSPEIQEKLKEFMSDLSKEERSVLSQKAKEALEGIEDMLNSNLKPQGTPGLIPSHEEQREAVKRDKQAKEQKEVYEEQKKNLESTMKEIKKKIDKEVNKKSIYEQNYNWIQKNIDFEKERDRFRRLFMPNYTIKSTLADTGSQGVDLLAAMQRKASKEMGDANISHEIWRNLEKPNKTSYAFTFLVDLSGSMDGDNIKNTLKALTFLNEIFADSYMGQVDMEILGFHTVPTMEVKKENFVFRSVRDKGHVEKVNQKIATMLKEVKSSGASYNDDGAAIRWATDHLINSPQKKKFLIVFSDGEPEYSPTYKYEVDEEQDTKNAIHEASIILGKDPFCFFLGNNGNPEEYYNIDGRENVLRETDPKKFIEQLSELLSIMIMYPNDYLRYVKAGSLDATRAENDFRKFAN